MSYSFLLLAIGFATADVNITPLHHVVAPNALVTFYCSGIGNQGTIFINNSAYFNYAEQFIIRGITFQNNTVTLIATKDKNNTIFQCWDIQSKAYSNVAVMIVAGPPSNPQPRTKVINSTELELSWDEPFAQPGFGTSNYTIRVLNFSSGAVVGVYSVHANRFSFAGAGSVGCSLLRFYVSAVNQIGASGEGYIQSGYPVVQGPMLPTPEVRVALTLSGNEGFAEVRVKIPPEICWYSALNYTVSVKELSSGATIFLASAHNAAVHLGAFSVFVVSRLIIGEVYIFVARVELISGDTSQTSNRIEVPSNFPNFEPSLTVHPTSLPSIQPSSSVVLPVISWVGYVCIAFILIGACAALIGRVSYSQCKKRKLQSDEKTRSDAVGTTDQIVVAASLVCNPIYAGPVYETVFGSVGVRHMGRNNSDATRYVKNCCGRKSSNVDKSIIALEESGNDHIRREEWFSHFGNIDDCSYPAKPSDQA